MANKNLFGVSKANRAVPTVDTVNNAGGGAYKFEPKAALAQIACTNCFNGTFYASASENLKLAKDAALALKGNPEFLAKAAVYSRTKGYMKDMPAFLAVVLAEINPPLFRKIFPLVIDNGKMLRNFCQIARSGATGRTFNLSAGTARNAINGWFNSQDAYRIFNASVGNDPSMRDILRMARPRPDSEEKAALFAYLKNAEVISGRLLTYNKDGSIKYSHRVSDLPAIVQAYENYKLNKEGKPPKVDFRLLDALGLTSEDWTEIARNAGWTMTRMNLNTFARHGVFDNKEVAKLVAERLRNPEFIQTAKAFPYQLMAAWKATEGNANIPFEVRDALQDAMEIAISNVPEFEGKVYVAVDTSGSMQNPITGSRGSSTTKISCVDVASLFAASVLRRNKSAEVIPFDTRVHGNALNGRDSVLTNAGILAKFGGGGTDCSCAVKHLNDKGAKGDAIIFVSDNESWVDSASYRGTGLMTEWQKFKARNRGAKLICIDLTPRDNSQVKENADILSVAGFSDAVFNVAASFIEYGHSKNHWVDVIEKIDLGGNSSVEEIADEDDE